MTKAVFFDLYHTLVRYQPPREELQAKALKDFGIEVKPEVFRRPLVIADEFIYQEIARSPLSQRSEKDKMALYARYQGILLKEAGIEASEQLILGLLGKMRQLDMKLVLFDDVMPALTDLKSKGLILGLISNVDRDINPLLNKLGLTSLLQVVVTSPDVGFNKPQPEIFQEALRQAEVQASEAIYVGDQYQIDVVGANKVGMKGVLLDRGDYFEEIADCPRIQSLIQLVELL
ncbi:MAG: HAD family hydrolase [Dehalococcoidales bacterium]